MMYGYPTMNQPMANGMMGTPNQVNFPSTNGVAFGSMMMPKTTSSTDEEINLIKAMGGTNFSFDANDSAVAGWDFREGSNLCLEIIDPNTDRVRAKYTGEEFNIMMTDAQNVQVIMDMLRDLVDTTKLLNVSLPKETSKQLYIASGVVRKLLPQAYENGKKNYNTVIDQARRQVANVGYNGGMYPTMFGGQYGMAPNYIMSDQNQAAPQMMYGQPNMMGQPQMMYGQPNMMGQPMMYGQPQMMGMGIPTAPVGGTMMGQNPFVQNGEPQAVPQMTGPVVPPPGVPQVPTTPNPSMGGQPQMTAGQPQMLNGQTSSASVTI